MAHQSDCALSGVDTGTGISYAGPCDCATKDFLRDLTDLSVKHKIGITTDGVLFYMEHDDMPESYAVDQDSKLVRQ